MSWGYYDYHYETIAEKKEKAQKALEKLRKKDKDISPVVISGNKIAKSFWAVSWNKNLESYADYANRIGRGSSYVKGGMVLDLKIEEGLVKAVVMGSRTTPYDVKITIQKMPQDKWNNIVGEVGRKISNVEELAAGKFPQDLTEKLLNQ
ncbi:MAG: hypothetical protein FWD71_22795, partial [Oscillospiraceae bacterium]|nr:hypothetical protein [Oscillospiraceae bacterium]